MSDKYTGKVGPADAMGVFDSRFDEAYNEASAALLVAVIEFERKTGRVVDSIDLGYVDVTTLADPAKRRIRTAGLHYLPTPGEVDW